jgi:hypothetical protein
MGEEGEHGFGRSGSRDVEIVDMAASCQVSHAAAHQVGLEPLRAEPRQQSEYGSRQGIGRELEGGHPGQCTARPGRAPG